jgi:hypothetical protein
VFNGCDMSIHGKLTLTSVAGIDVRSNVHSDNVASFNADSNNDGSGVLTVAEGKTISTRNSLLTVYAADAHLLGTLTSGSGSTQFIPTAGNNIGLGSTAKDVHISDEELGSFVAGGGLTFGDASSGAITVTGITDANSDDIGTLSLVATKAAATVQFVTTPSSFQKGLQVHAHAGVTVAASVTSKSTPSLFNCGTATLTVAALQSLSTSDQLLLVTANDVDISGSLSTGVVGLACTTPDRIIGVGNSVKLAALGTPAQAILDQHELQRTTALGLSLGGPTCGSQHVIGVENAHVSQISGIISLVANRDDASVTFSEDPSTFLRVISL